LLLLHVNAVTAFYSDDMLLSVISFAMLHALPCSSDMLITAAKNLQ